MKLCTSSLRFQTRLAGLVKTTSGVSLLHKRHLHYPLPWPKIALPWPRTDHRNKLRYFLNRILGKVLLRVTSSKWSEKEFLVGAEYAIKEFASILNTPELREELKSITSEELHSCINNSLDKIQPTWTLGLQVHEISDLVVGDIRSIAGIAPEGKEHVMDLWGHKVVTSQEMMDSILKESGGKSSLTLQDFRKISNLAFNQRQQFQIDVTFNMTESYWLANEDGAIVEGSRTHTSQSNHKWTFGSQVNNMADYPFSWIITNVNDFITTNHVKISYLI